MSASATATHTVLTIEDDPIVRADVRLILEEAGFRVCTDARDGVEGVELAREHRPDLVLLDLGLPRLSGVDAARLISGEHDVPIVALTGASSPLLGAALEAGATHHLAKPFSDGALLRTVRTALAERGSVTVPVRHPVSAEPAVDRTALIHVEQMVRDGLSQHEIEWVLYRDYGYGAPARSSLRDGLRRLLGRG